MPLTYPLALSDWFELLPIAKLRFALSEALSYSRTSGGELIVDRIGTPLWSATLELGRLTPSELSSVEALVEAARGPGRTAFVSTIQQAGPKSDPGGVTLGAATPSIQSTDRQASTITIAGLPAGYMLSRGDFLSIDFDGTRTSLHRVVDLQGLADGAGVMANLQVEPNVPFSVVANDPLRLIKPRMKAILVPNSLSAGRAGRWMAEGVSFEMQQTLGA